MTNQYAITASANDKQNPVLPVEKSSRSTSVQAMVSRCVRIATMKPDKNLVRFAGVNNMLPFGAKTVNQFAANAAFFSPRKPPSMITFQRLADGICLGNFPMRSFWQCGRNPVHIADSLYRI
jgi:hypothetical protein